MQRLDVRELNGQHESMADPETVLPATIVRIETRNGRVFALRHPIPPMTPPAAGEERDPIEVTSIALVVDELTGEPEYWIFSRAMQDQPEDVKAIAVLTKIPGSEVVRSDCFMSVQVMEQQLYRIYEPFQDSPEQVETPAGDARDERTAAPDRLAWEGGIQEAVGADPDTADPDAGNDVSAPPDPTETDGK